MSNNIYYLEIINQIADIQNNNFEIKTLRTALEINNKVAFFLSEGRLSKKEFNNINNFLKETIERKFLELNPEFSKSTLNKICKCYNREYICLPNDISIIDNNIVFYQENNYGNPYDTHIVLLNDNSKNKFNTIKKLETISSKNLNYASEMITFINGILRPFFKKDSPVFSLKNNILESNSSVNLFISPNLNHVIDNINQKNNTTFDLIVLTDWNDFHYFRINAKFSKNKKNIQWSWKLVKPNIWNLTEELEKNYNNSYVLKRKK